MRSGSLAGTLLADQPWDVEVDGPPLATDLIHQTRALHLVEPQPAPEGLDRATILGHAAALRVGSQRRVEFLRNVTEMKRRHGKTLA